MALRGTGGTVPAWYHVLSAAKEWGTRPWKLDNSKPPIWWFGHWQAVKEIQAMNGTIEMPPDDGVHMIG